MTNVLDFTYVQTVTVDTYLGTTASGPAWDTGNVRRCSVEESTKLVRDSTGAEVVSSATVFDELNARTIYTAGSKVTLPSGRTARVLAMQPFDSGSLNLGLDHIEAHLT